jgi:hypothetical protein
MPDPWAASAAEAVRSTEATATMPIIVFLTSTSSHLIVVTQQGLRWAAL